MATAAHHARLLDGFQSIQDKNALAWAVLDHKSELFLCAAVATAINRRAGHRLAHIEFLRADLVLLRAPLQAQRGGCLDPRGAQVDMRYEAKAGQFFDFAPRYDRAGNEYVGGHLNRDIRDKKLVRGSGAGLFFISEVSEPHKHLKYFAGHTTGMDTAIAVLKRHVPLADLVAHETIDCGVADGAAVKIHMCVFDPK
jgi:hypothetical protein